MVELVSVEGLREQVLETLEVEACQVVEHAEGQVGERDADLRESLGAVSFEVSCCYKIK